MGNSLGGMKLYTDLEDKYEAYQGGFIWDYIDQSLYKDGILVYGGDFDDRQSDYGFCTNGIIYADRTYSPKVQEVRQLYSNIRMSIENGVLTVENRNLFIDTSGYIFKITLEKEGEILAAEEHCLSISAGEKGSVKIGLTVPEKGGEYVLTACAVLAQDTIWAEKGHEVSFAQEIINAGDGIINVPSVNKAEIVWGSFCVGVHGEDFSMLFDYREGGIASLVYDGFEYITRTPKVSFYRAITDNDRGAGYPYDMAQWQIAGKCAKLLGEKLSTNVTDDSLEITFVYLSNTVPTFEYKVIYTAYFDGRLGVYTSTAQENFTKYLNPQECGNRTGVRYVKVYDENGRGLKLTASEKPFEMSVLPYSAHELDHALHREELPEPSYNWVRIAAKQMGVGGDDSWGAPVHEEFRINAEEAMSINFEIKKI